MGSVGAARSRGADELMDDAQRLARGRQTPPGGATEAVTPEGVRVRVPQPPHVDSNLRMSIEGSEGASRSIPHGFTDQVEFQRFTSRLNSGLQQAGVSDARIIFQGSSVTGSSFRTGRPFDAGRLSDLDVAIASPTLMERARSLGINLRSGGTRTGPLQEGDLEMLGLTQLNRSLSDMAGRDVNFMIYESADAALARSPSIAVQ